MPLSLSPKLRRNIARIIPFGIIWLVMSWVFLINDLSLTRSQNINPDTDITITVPVFIFASLAVTVFGLMIGAFEMVVLEKRFNRFSLTKKIAYKFAIYLFLTLLIISVAYPIAASIEAGTPIYDPEIWRKMGRFFISATFVNTLVQLAFSLLLSVLYAVVSENLGYNVLRNLVTGKYHTPTVEERIFMFLDMKNSTTIAEQLGHVRYFELLRAYYDMMSDAIIDSWGEVYQYIGDEVVITWKADQGFRENNCVNCFLGIKDSFERSRNDFLVKYGAVPDFKAGMHVGEVTTGEVGALKREIVFTGDVLNTAARLQSLCKEHYKDLIISSEIYTNLEDKDNLATQALGAFTLKGKSKRTELYAVARKRRSNVSDRAKTSGVSP
jgi:adenylate cyclase